MDGTRDDLAEDLIRTSISEDGADLEPERQIVGRKIWRIFPYMGRYKTGVAGGILTNAGARVFDLIPFVAIGWATDFYASGGEGLPNVLIELAGDRPEIFFGVLIFLGFAFLACFQGLSDYLWQSTAYRIQHDLRMDATRSLMAMEASYFDTQQSGNLMSVLSSDIGQLEDVISDSSTSIIRLVITFSAAAIILSIMSWKLAAVLFLPILILVLPVVTWFSLRVAGRYKRQRESTGGIVAILENVLSGVSVVQAYNASEFETERIESESKEYRDQSVKASGIRNRFVPLLYIIAGIGFGMLISVGGVLMRSGEIRTGEFVTFLLISTRMTMPLFIAGLLMQQLQRGEAAARRVFAIVDLEPSIVDGPDAEPLVDPIEQLTFEDVTFTYPAGEEAVLNNIDLSVESGGFMGIMGHTGAGKSTILKLIERFYVPDSGSVQINGRCITSYTIESVRDRIGFVSQDPFLFFGTVRDNVAYARDATSDDIEAALRLAGAWDFVSDLPKGMDTEVGDRGVMLSGGQRARINLARALLTDPDLLILDEASSALDAETEQRIQENLFNGGDGRGRLTIAVAHRLATIRNADEILAMVDGSIVERGNHTDLVASDNVYASQWRIQTGEMAGH